MERDVFIAVPLAAVFTLLIALIEIAYQSKVRHVFVWCFRIGFLLYLLVLLAGNVATTMAATSVLKPFIDASAAAPAQAGSQDEPGFAKQPAPPLGTGLPWFWYAFLGVFGFEAVLQRVNVTFANQGVLTINDWISKARDSAVASAIASQVEARTKREQQLADRLVASNISDADLNTYVENWLGGGRVSELDQAAGACGANPRLMKALALATGAYDRAAALRC